MLKLHKTPTIPAFILILIWNLSLIAQGTTQPETQKNADFDSLLTVYEEKAQQAKNEKSEAYLLYNDTLILLAKQYNDPLYLAKAFLQRAKLLQKTNRKEEVKQYYYKTLSIYKEQNANKDAAYIYRLLGYLTDEEFGEYFNAVSYYDTALRIMSENTITDTSLMAGITLNKGMAYSKIGKQDSVLSMFSRSLELYTRAKDTLGMIQATNNIGSYYNRTGKHEKAISTFQRALSMGEGILPTTHLVSLSTNLANLHVRTKNITQAVEIYNQLLDELSKSNDVKLLAHVYSNFGVVLSMNNRFEEAVSYLHKGKALRKEAGLNEEVTSSYYNLGMVFEDWGKSDSQLYYYDLCRIWAQKTRNKNNLYLANNALFKTFRANGNYDKALEHLHKANDIAKESKILERIYTSYLNLASFYNQLNRNKEAYEYQVLHTTYKDSFLNVESQNKIAQLNAQFETERKEKEIEILTKENTLRDLRIEQQEAEVRRKAQQNNWIIFASSLSLVMLFIFGVLYRQKFKAIYLAQITSNELKAFRAQMNPHFIFNALSSVQYYISQNQKNKADQFLTSFSKLTRRILSQSEHDHISLAEEMETLNLFLKLEQIRMKNKFDYQIQVSDDLDPENIEIPSMLIQPLAENAVWHGVANATGTGKIKINFTREKDRLCISVEDNGPGFKNKPKNKNHKSQGLGITESRIARFNNTKPGAAQFQFTSLNPGLRISFSIPYMEAF